MTTTVVAHDSSFCQRVRKRSVKRARVLGFALVGLGVGQIAITLSPGEPDGWLLLVSNVLFTFCGVLMAWRPEWADGRRSSGWLQRRASRPWFLLCGGCILLGLAALAIAVGSTIAV